MTLYSRIKFTLIMVLVSVVFMGISHWYDTDLFEVALEQLSHMEAFEGDELVIVLLLLIIGVIWDINKARAQHRLQNLQDAHRLSVLRATMSTVHDIVNNTLSQMQMVLFMAKNGKTLDQDMIHSLEVSIADSTQRLKAIENVDCVEIDHGKTTLPHICVEEK